MDILLYKDGHLTISESPLEGKENNLDDVVMLVTNPQDGDTLTYKSGKWVNGAGGGGSFAPDITNPQDGDTLVYNATAGKWVNGSGGGGGAMVLTPTVTETGVTFGATYAEVKAAMMSGRDVVYVGLAGENVYYLYRLIECDDATDITHGDKYVVLFYNPQVDNPDMVYADTEDGELYITFGG